MTIYFRKFLKKPEKQFLLIGEGIFVLKFYKFPEWPVNIGTYIVSCSIFSIAGFFYKKKKIKRNGG